MLYFGNHKSIISTPVQRGGKLKLICPLIPNNSFPFVAMSDLSLGFRNGIPQAVVILFYSQKNSP